MDAEISAMPGKWYCYGVMMSPGPGPGPGSSFSVRDWSSTTRLKLVRVIKMMGAEPGGKSHCCCSA